MGFLLDEDESVFQAALSFVDSAAINEPLTVIEEQNATPSFNVDCVEMVTMMPFTNIKSLRVDANSAGFSLEGIKPRKRNKFNPNRARDDVQYELVYLRDKVEELETKLRSLQLNTSPSDQNADLGTCSPLVRVPRVWEDMATRQKRQCELAQHDNARLKVLVERKQKMAVNLCEMIRKRLHHQSSECVRLIGVEASEQQTIQVLDFHGDIKDFQDLFQRLEVAFQEQEAVFASLNNQIPTDDVHVREVDDMHIEVFASKMFPFSLHDTGEAAWDHFKGIEKHLGNGGLYGKSTKNLEQPFTILEVFTKEVFSKNLRADVQAKQIVRRCVEPDRDMILFVSSMTPTEIKHKATNGLIFHAQEYALTSRVPNSASGLELSLLQLYTRVSIECSPGVTFDSRYIRSAARFWIGNIAGNIRCYQERIENALIDRALGSRMQ